VSLGWIVLLVCFLTGCVFFFSVNSVALRTFSLAKLHDAFKKINKENLIDGLAENAEQLILACSLYRLIANCCILRNIFTFQPGNSSCLGKIFR